MATVADPNKVKVLQTAMSRASKLMRLESNGSLDKIAKAHKDDINLSLDPTNNITTESMVTTQNNRSAMAPQIGGQMSASAMNVPSVIRESFMKNPIDDSALYTASLGDGMDVSFLTEKVGNKQIRQQVNPEQIRQIVSENTHQTQMPSQSIDYPMIRTIVEEIVRKYTASLSKKMLNESKQDNNEINTIMLGKGFKFLDSKGNLYECTMKKIGNLNDKKKTL